MMKRKVLQELLKLQWNNNEFFGDIFMYKSLEYLLKKYPFFLDKKEDSNFTKTKKVFNNRLQDINNDLFKVKNNLIILIFISMLVLIILNLLRLSEIILKLVRRKLSLMMALLKL